MSEDGIELAQAAVLFRVVMDPPAPLEDFSIAELTGGERDGDVCVAVKVRGDDYPVGLPFPGPIALKIALCIVDGVLGAEKANRVADLFVELIPDERLDDFVEAVTSWREEWRRQ